MSPDRHARIKELFLAACALPPEERTTFLWGACGGDPELQASVEELLRHYIPGTISPELAEDRAAAVAHAPEAGGSDLTSESDAVVALGGARDRPPGTIVAGRYRVVALLGKGGMGEVYRADDLVLDQTVALKFLPQVFADDPAWLARLRGEVRVARKVTSPHVCRVHDIVEADGDCFITMQYVDGEDLRSLLNRIGRIPQDKALDIARQLCAGLAAAHARGVLHRDLKPANIMLDGRGHVVITDFGLAGTVRDIRPEEFRAGTPAYMAPEQLAGREVTVRSDIYAMGLVLYELFTGKPAFHAKTVTEYADVRSSQTPSLPSTLTPGIDPVIDRVILRCLEKEPQDRPPSVLTVAGALPGGDPLAADLEAGEIPSPEMVIAAGEASGISLRRATAGLIAVFAMLIPAILFSSRAHPVSQARLSRSPEVLAEKARDLLGSMIGLEVPAHEASGLLDRRDCPFIHYAADQGRFGEPEFAFAGAVPLAFWYRAAPTGLVPGEATNLVFGNARVRLEDPTPTAPGMATVILDIEGRLAGLQVVPRHFEAAAASAAPVDWLPFFLQAGLDASRLRPAEPVTTPRVYAATRSAWRGLHPDDPRRPIRIETAACRGRPVCFVVLSDRPAGNASSWLTDSGDRWAVVGRVQAVLLTLLVLISLALARANLRQGRSDPRGALRLAVFVFAIRVLVWSLRAAHVAELDLEYGLIRIGLVGAFAEAALAWLFYVALEPLVRRFWPQVLIAWARVLAGRFRDPLVGGHVLLGAVVGVFWVLLIQLDQLITSGLGLVRRQTLRPDDFFDAVMGGRQACAFCLGALQTAVYDSLFILLLLVVLRAVLRRTFVANLVGVLLIIPLFVPRGSHAVVSLFVVGLGGVAVAMCILIRCGLVPIVTALWVTMVLLRFPLTLGVRVWYADYSLFAVVLVAGIAVLGFLAARRSRPGVQSGLW